MRVASSEIRGAVRGLARSAPVAVLALLCFALGVGASTAMSLLLDALLLRPPAGVRDPGSVRRLYFSQTLPGLGEVSGTEASFRVLGELQETVEAFSALEAFYSTDLVLGRGQEARKARAVLVTPGFLPMLGTPPLLGRTLEESPGPGSGAVAVLGYNLWRRDYGGSPAVLGRHLAAGGDDYTIIGVMPRGFDGVDPDRVDLWLPMAAAGRLVSPRWATSRGLKFLEIVGRLRSDVSSVAAEAAGTSALRTASAAAGRPQPTARLLLGRVQRSRAPGTSLSAVRLAAGLAGVSWAVLLLACINVTYLLLVRSAERGPEMAIRSALGARPLRLAGLIWVESLGLAAVGGILSVAVSYGLTAWFSRAVLPEAAALPALDFRRLALTLVLSLLAGGLAGGIPARRTERQSLSSPLWSGQIGRSAQTGRFLLGLAAGQIALTFVLLVGGAQLVRNLYGVLHLDLGLDPDRVLVAGADFETGGLPPGQVEALLREAAGEVERFPGVAGASLAATVPFETSWAAKVAVPGAPALPELPTGGPYLNAVSERFFEVTGTRLLAGRPFAPTDRSGGARTAIVGHTFAHLAWPAASAIGRCIQIGGDAAPCSVVVGVVEDARRSGVQEGETLQVYVPLGQAPEELTSRALFLRVDRDGPALRQRVARAVQRRSPPTVLVSVASLGDRLVPQLRPLATAARVLTLFGILAWVLALAGLYGVVAHSFGLRLSELGIRIALGSDPGALLRLALRRSLGFVAIGLSAGWILSLLTGRFLADHLGQPGPAAAADPWLPAGIAVALGAFAAVACYLPTRRVRKLDPARVLRS